MAVETGRMRTRFAPFFALVPPSAGNVISVAAATAAPAPCKNCLRLIPFILIRILTMAGFNARSNVLIYDYPVIVLIH